MLRLPDTGATSSYTTTFGEDNDYTINPPYFLLNGDGTVTDTVTALMWQRIDGGEMTIEDAHNYCDTLTLAGYSNWRLPTAQEGFSILNMQYANPAIDTTIFKKSLAEYWWTSERQANDTTKIWATNKGGGIGNHPKAETLSADGTKRFHVRAVRDVTPPSSIPNAFTDNGDGSITDNLTQLIWQKVAYTDTLTWEQALQYADTLSLSNATDWRLPNIKELQSINEENSINPSVNTNFFTLGTARKFWSSTSLPNQPAKAWYWFAQFGVTTYDVKTLGHSILCVRGASISTGLASTSLNKMLVYPNPFTSVLQVSRTSTNEKFVLTDLFGKIIYKGTELEKQDFTRLRSGIYFLHSEGRTNSTIKLIKL